MDLVTATKTALLELRDASLSITDEQTLLATMRKFDTVFMGERINIIECVGLNALLKTRYGVEATLEQLNSVIPAVCGSLGMEISGLIAVSDIGKPDAEIGNYRITLYK